MVATDAQEEVSRWEALRKNVEDTLEQAKREMSEIDLMLEQSQLEVNKLTQRNASISAHLQQVQGQFESLPRADIRMAYDSALDSQQRLFKRWKAAHRTPAGGAPPIQSRRWR